MYAQDYGQHEQNTLYLFLTKALQAVNSAAKLRISVCEGKSWAQMTPGGHPGLLSWLPRAVTKVCASVSRSAGEASGGTAPGGFWEHKMS